MKGTSKIAALIGLCLIAVALSASWAQSAKAYVPPGVTRWQGPDLTAYSQARSITVYNNGAGASGGFWVHVTPGVVCGAGVGDQWHYVSGLVGYGSTTFAIDQASSYRTCRSTTTTRFRRPTRATTRAPFPPSSAS